MEGFSAGWNASGQRHSGHGPFPTMASTLYQKPQTARKFSTPLPKARSVQRMPYDYRR